MFYILTNERYTFRSNQTIKLTIRPDFLLLIFILIKIATKTTLKCSIVIQQFSTVTHKLRDIISNRSCMSCADYVMWPCLFLTVQQTNKQWLSERNDMIFQVPFVKSSSLKTRVH